MNEPSLILQVPVLSTVHIPGPSAPEDSSLLYAAYSEGWFIYIEDELEPDAPEWYRVVQTWAALRGYKWVRFDADGDVLATLPSYTEGWL